MRDKGLIVPTHVQKVVIPIILAKHNYDMIVQAQTGTGKVFKLLLIGKLKCFTMKIKTAAFLLPIIHTLAGQKAKKEIDSLRGPYAMIIAPTRELAQQLGDTARAFARSEFRFRKIKNNVP